jgi:hypothetical protein
MAYGIGGITWITKGRRKDLTQEDVQLIHRAKPEGYWIPPQEVKKSFTDQPGNSQFPMI